MIVVSIREVLAICINELSENQCLRTFEINKSDAYPLKLSWKSHFLCSETREIKKNLIA